MTPFIAGIRYLNSRPYFQPLLSGAVPSRFRIELMTPAEANEAVLSGRADAGLISSIAYGRARDTLVRISGLEIASHGPVRSIMLFADRDLGSFERIAVTVESATSVAMLRVLLDRRGARPELVPASDPMAELDSGGADGALLIGDAALFAKSAARFVWDLGALWQDAFGAPMVYAVFALRADRADQREEMAHDLRSALDWSREHLDAIVDSAYNAPPNARERARLKDYLERLDEARRSDAIDAGLEIFLGEAMGKATTR